MYFYHNGRSRISAGTVRPLFSAPTPCKQERLSFSPLHAFVRREEEPARLRALDRRRRTSCGRMPPLPSSSAFFFRKKILVAPLPRGL